MIACRLRTCDRERRGAGLCAMHQHRLDIYGDPHFDPVRTPIERRLEDVRWMAETGECLTGAARRLGMSDIALERWLRRHDPEVITTLIKRQPRDHNAIAELGAVGITPRAIRNRRRKRLLREQRQQEGAAA